MLNIDKVKNILIHYLIDKAEVEANTNRHSHFLLYQ